ncbi:MAG: sodium-dependent transporter [Thermoanaerobaculia bacterium]
MTAPSHLWSSRAAFYLGAIGAAVGLGSIWRFPYLAGTSGGFAFVAVFVVACAAIATPLLVAEFLIGRWSRQSPPLAFGEIAALAGRGRGWNLVGWSGTVAAFAIFSYYTIIAGWVLAYAWKCAAGELSGLSHAAVAQRFADFVADPLRIVAWQALFLAIVAGISARGVHRGLEVANRLRAPVFLVLLLGLVGYALATGDVARGLRFAFAPDFAKITPPVVVAAVGQAFFATGVGMAMMLAYGAYVPRGASLLRSALLITGSIVLVSLLATLLVFPLVFAYGMNPAQGPELVFQVLPAAFAEMPAGRFVGAVFFILLAFAALTPSIAALEPAVAWLGQRHALPRRRAVALTTIAAFVLGLGSVLSFNLWAQWRPLAGLGRFGTMSFFGLIDFVSSNILLEVGAVATSVFVGWLLAARIPDEELAELSPGARRALLWSLRYLCPLAVLAVLVAAFL